MSFLAVQHADGRFRIHPWNEPGFTPGTEFKFPDGTMHKVTKDGYLNISAKWATNARRSKGHKYITVDFSSKDKTHFAVAFGKPHKRQTKYLSKLKTGQTGVYPEYIETEYPEDYAEYSWSPER
jgi:hypothetical protein